MKKTGTAVGIVFLATLFAGAVALADDDVEVRGPIQDFSADHVTVEGTTFVINGDTEFEHGAMEDMAVGVDVKVNGQNEGGTLFADQIEFGEDDDNGEDDNEIEVKGIIDDITPDTIVVEGTEFLTDSDTKYRHTSRENLAAGDVVKVEAVEQSDGSYLAKKVEAENEDDDDGDNDDREGRRSRDAGFVGNVSGGEFMLNGENYLFDDSTRFNIKSFDGEFDPADFTEGLMIKVRFVKNDNGDLVATRVTIYLPMYKYCGEIESIDGNSVTVMGVEFTLGDWTEFSETSSLSDFSVGDFTEVKGLLWFDDSLMATELEPCDDNDFDVRGEISGNTVDGSTGMLVLDVGGVLVLVTPSTRIRGGSESDLLEGTEVQVSGDEYVDGMLVARKIRIR